MKSAVDGFERFDAAASGGYPDPIAVCLAKTLERRRDTAAERTLKIRELDHRDRRIRAPQHRIVGRNLDVVARRVEHRLDAGSGVSELVDERVIGGRALLLFEMSADRGAHRLQRTTLHLRLILLVEGNDLALGHRLHPPCNLAFGELRRIGPLALAACSISISATIDSSA